jgi:hypothetical protein
LAWTIAVLIAVTTAAGLALWARSGFIPPPQVFFLSSLPYVLSVVMLATQGSASVLLTVRLPTNSVGWLIMAFAAILAGVVLANGYLALTETGWVGPLDPAWVAEVTAAGSLGTGVAIAVILGLVFPDGHLLSRGWRWAVGLAVVGAGVLAWATLISPGPILVYPSYRNPAPFVLDPTTATLARVVGSLILLMAAAGTGLGLAARYRSADEIGRLQLRWYVVSGIALVIGLVAFIAAVLTLAPDSELGQMVTIAFYIAIAIPPFALAFAILRYRLYDMGSVIGRAVVYSALTAILAGIYTASIRLFNALFVGLTGEQSELALVITTLLLATTFTPIKGRLEQALAGHAAAPAEPITADREWPATSRPGSSMAAALFDDPDFVAALETYLRDRDGGSPVAKKL